MTIVHSCAVIERVESAFTRLLSNQSQQVELERNNVAQQALLYRDGWYGHYDLTSNDKHVKPYFEAGSSRLKLMRKKKDAAVNIPLGTAHVSVDEVKGLVGGVKMGMPQTRVVHAESLARSCLGHLAPECRAAILRLGGIAPLVVMVNNGQADEKGAAA